MEEPITVTQRWFAPRMKDGLRNEGVNSGEGERGAESRTGSSSELHSELESGALR